MNYGEKGITSNIVFEQEKPKNYAETRPIKKLQPNSNIMEHISLKRKISHINKI